MGFDSENPDVLMSDPRQEAAQTMEGVRDAAGNMLKTMGSMGKLTTHTYLKLLAMRRSQFVESVDSGNAARSMVNFCRKIE